MEENNLEAKRRNLILSSVLLSTYFFAGGQITDEKSGTFGLLFISLDRPLVALAVAWIAWLYFLWRFYLSTQYLGLNQFEKDIAIQLSRRPTILRMIQTGNAELEALPWFPDKELAKKWS